MNSITGEEPAKHRIYTHEFVVQPNEIDAMGHVNNVVYLKWVQDAAEAHWLTKASQDVKAKYSWVVLRHEIDYLAPAFAGQTIEATTWVENYQGVRSDRIVHLINKESKKVLAKAKTTWCLLDAVTKRPKRIESDIASVFSQQ
jgi:acyl-CoA thioester hydrolase